MLNCCTRPLTVVPGNLDEQYHTCGDEKERDPQGKTVQDHTDNASCYSSKERVKQKKARIFLHKEPPGVGIRR
jgi:hypothetical protein